MWHATEYDSSVGVGCYFLSCFIDVPVEQDVLNQVEKSKKGVQKPLVVRHCSYVMCVCNEEGCGLLADWSILLCK